jgi:excisionase family DNA binding protein
MNDRLLYNKKEAAAQLSISVSTLDQLIAQGELEVRRLGVRILIPRRELERLATHDVAIVWPQKINGKTVRTKSEAA